MDIAAVILAPLAFALIYCWSGIGKLPFIVRVGLPVGLLAALFVALIGYGPAVQEAVATNTPLIRTFDLRNFALHLDGLALLFGLLITGVGAMIALYAGSTFAEGDAHRRFVRGLMALVGLMIGVVLTDHTVQFFAFWMLTIISSFLFMRQGGNKRAWIAFAIAALGGIALLMGLLVLPEAGAQVRMSEQPIDTISQLGMANLSTHEAYNTYFILILIGTLSAGLQVFFSQGDPWVAPTQVSFCGGIYLLARLYPAIHDNPLWWDVVTGIGLFIMLIGAVWALRQSDPKAIIVCRSMSLFGACVALLGLPEFLGVKVALIGIVVHALSGSALFLSTDMNLAKRSRLIVVGLAKLPMTIFHMLMIGVFYQVTLAWAGIALAVVMVSAALWGVSTIGILRGTSRDEMGATTAGRPTGSPLQSRYLMGELGAGILGVASLVCVALFDPIFAPLLNPMMTRQPLVENTITPLILAVLALIGGVILHATRDTWGRFIQAAPLAVLDNVHEV